MGALFCTGCGKNLEPGATFCTQCGCPTGDQPPAAPPPASDDANALPICGGCGIVALPACLACTECGHPIASSPCVVPRVHGDLIWAAVQASITCRACGGQAPIDGFEIQGPYPCIHCGIEQHMDPKQWEEALRDAHDVADLARPGHGAFPDVAYVGDNRYLGVGGEYAKVSIDTSHRDDRSIPLHLDVSPGNPLCEACHVPLEVVSAESRLVVRCPKCETSQSYTRPAGSPHDLVGVVGRHNQEGVHDVAADRDPGGAVAMRCPGCSAPLPAAAIGAAITCAYCGVTSRIGPAMRHAMGNKDATPPRWWALFRGPCRTRLKAHKDELFRAREAAERESRAAAKQAARDAQVQADAARARAHMAAPGTFQGFDALEQQAEIAGKKKDQLATRLTIALSATMCLAFIGVYLAVRSSESKTPSRTASKRMTASAPPAPAPPPTFSVSWTGKVLKAQGKSLKPGTPCRATMDAAGQKVTDFRVICGSTALYGAHDSMIGMGSTGSAIIEAPGDDDGHRYLLVYYDTGERQGRSEISFNSASISTASSRASSPFKVTMRFDDLSTERMGPAVFPTSINTSHQLFTAKVVSVDGRPPLATGQSCKLDFFGRGVKADGDVCTVKLDCGKKTVYFTTAYCKVDTSGRPASFTDKSSSSSFSLDVAGKSAQLGGETATSGSFTAQLALTPATH